MRYFSFITYLVVLTFVFPCVVQANDYDASKGEYRRLPEERVFIVGRIVDIAQELQHRPGGADSQPALFSKGRQGLKTSGGTIWTFVDNIKGQSLQWDKQFLGKYVRIHGWAFHDAQYIEVESFTANEIDFKWNKKSSSFQPTS